MRVPPNFSRILLTAIVALAAFLALYVFRAADDNSITSWQRMIDGRNVTLVYLLLIAGIVIAYPISRMSLTGRSARILLFSTSFGIAALFWNTPDFILDSSRYFAQAKSLELYGIGYFVREWGREIPAWTDLPAIPFIYGLLFKIFGESRVPIQMFTTLLFSLTVVMTCLLGKALWDEDAGLRAGALMLGIPYLFTQTPLMLVDVPLMFLLVLAVYTVIRALEHGGTGRIALASTIVFLLFFSKYSAWPMISALFIVVAAYLLAGDQPRGNTVSRAGAIIALSCAFIGAIFFLKFDVFTEQIRFLTEFQGPGLRRWGESFTSTFLFQMHPFIALAALYSVYVAVRKKDLRYLIIAWLPILVFAFQIKRSRYTVPVFPMFALMASYGLQQIKDRDVRKFITTCAVVSSLVISMAVYLPFMRRLPTLNVKEAGAFLNTIDAGAAEIITVAQKGEVANPAVLVPLLDLYTKKRLLYRYEPGYFPPAAEIAMSNLRFTWEYKSPKYYAYDDKTLAARTALVVISRNLDEALPPAIALKARHYSRSRVFDTSDVDYYYKITVRVYW